MVKIEYTDHLSLRIKIRNFPEEYPRIILKEPDIKLFDKVEKTLIAIKRLKYNGKIRNIMIAYEDKQDIIEIITIHPISDEKIINRKLSGRWVENG